MKETILISIVALLLMVPFSGCIELIPTNEYKLIYVDDDGGADYTQIQKALESASDGDTIFVHNGTYFETLIINNSITLKGASKDETIIDYQKNDKGNQTNIILINSNDCTIKDLKIIGSGTSSSDTVGIFINASNSTISNNIVLKNYKGIYTSKGSEKNNIYWNNISNNVYGISTRFSDNNYISKNNISKNSLYGIHLSVSYYNTIYGNKVSNNFYGMRIKSSENNEVFSNIVKMNKRGILFCCGSGNNIIYYNTFQQNSEWNAHDEVLNQWDNGTVGNHWDDYTGKDDNSDGIGDTPYNITDGKGVSNNEDRFPLIE
jgi:parallel beta-helix repeat protein